MNYAYWYSKRSSNGNLPGSNDIAPSLHVMRTGSHLSTPFPDLSTAKFLSDWKELKCMNLDSSYTCGGARNTELVECSSNISCGVHHWKRKKRILKQENARYKFINTLFFKNYTEELENEGPMEIKHSPCKQIVFKSHDLLKRLIFCLQFNISSSLKKQFYT